MSQEMPQVVTAFGYEIVRDHLLSSVLGKNEHEILYWAGKELARKFPASSLEEVVQFFEDASWGTLVLEKDAKDQAFYALTGSEDLLHITQRCFRLEAGFLAQQCQQMNGFLTECSEEKQAKKNQITLHVKWDLKDPIA